MERGVARGLRLCHPPRPRVGHGKYQTPAPQVPGALPTPDSPPVHHGPKQVLFQTSIELVIKSVKLSIKSVKLPIKSSMAHWSLIKPLAADWNQLPGQHARDQGYRQSSPGYQCIRKLFLYIKTKNPLERM